MAEAELLPPGPPSAPPGASAASAPAPDATGQLELLRRFEEPDFQELFGALRADPVLNPHGLRHGPGAAIENGFYPTPDAEIYAALILLNRPRRVIEVGSGFSTVVARRAVEAAGLSTEIHVIDPSPRRAVEDVADRVEHAPVEGSSLAADGVPTDSLLFIDSSHVTRAGGDGPFLYGTLLPALPAGVLVQVHDVFLPYDYPRVYVERFYTEQYLLQALLANSVKFEPVLAAYMLSVRHAAEMRRAFGEGVARDGRFQGASYWMRSVT